MKYLIVFSVLFVGALSYAQDEPEITKIKVDALPKKIVAVAQKEFPGLSVDEAYVEKREDLKVYYISLTDPKDDVFSDITIDETGKVLGRARNIALDKIPPKIRDIAKKTFPDYTIDDAVFEQGEDGDLYSLALLHNTDDDKYGDITISAKGIILAKGNSITPQAVPDAVKKALKKKYALSQIFEASQFIEFEDGKETYYYSLTVMTPKEMRYIDFDSKGKIFSDLSEDEL